MEQIPDPHSHSRRVSKEVESKFELPREENKRPKPKKGDSFISLGALIGLFLGGYLGYCLTHNLAGIIPGLVIGGIMFTLLASYLVKKFYKKSEK